MSTSVIKLAEVKPNGQFLVVRILTITRVCKDMCFELYGNFSMLICLRYRAILGFITLSISANYASMQTFANRHIIQEHVGVQTFRPDYGSWKKSW